jgi:large subunit ribosomal protein L15
MGAGLPKFVTVNLADIEAANFSEGEEVSLESLIAKRVLNPSGREERLRLKVLGDGELSTKLTVKAGSFSASAKAKLEEAGSTLVDVPGRRKWVKPSVTASRYRAEEYFAKKRASDSWVEK